MLIIPRLWVYAGIQCWNMNPRESENWNGKWAPAPCLELQHVLCICETVMNLCDPGSLSQRCVMIPWPRFTHTYNGIQNSTFTCGIHITSIPLNLSTKTYYFEVINSECRLTAYTLCIKYDRLQPLQHKCWQCKLTNPASGEKMISYLKETLWHTSSCITVWPHCRSIQRLYTSSSHGESLSLKYLRNDPIKHSWLCKEHTENTGLLTLPVFPLKTSSLSIITSIEGRRVRERKSLAA